jgi:parvulin-like peptidyl-prolyl isomerase
VKNVTVSLTDEVYRNAKIKAAERNTSLSALVRQFLQTLGDEEDEFRKLERLQEQAYSEIKSFRASTRLNREELHRRGKLH